MSEVPTFNGTNLDGWLHKGREDEEKFQRLLLQLFQPRIRYIIL